MALDQNDDYSNSGGADDDQTTVYDDGSTLRRLSNGTIISKDSDGNYSVNKVNTDQMGKQDGLPGNRTYNPLSEFSSYNYQLSMYMVTQDAYNQYMLNGERVMNDGFYLVAQSGGKNSSVNSIAPGFENIDVYIDNLTLHTATSPKFSGVSVPAIDMAFDIIEPYGKSFPTRLRDAAEILSASSTLPERTTELSGIPETSAALAQPFIMAIRFYGYDADGNQVRADQYGITDSATRHDSHSTFEKIYEFRIDEMKFGLSGTSTVYNIKASNVSVQAATGAKRGRINTAMNISGDTVSSMLTGNSGLTEFLNKMQQHEDVEIPNTYNIVFDPPNGDLAKASMILPGDKDKSRNAPPPAKKSDDSNDAASAASTPDNSKRTINITNDTPIIQAIDNVLTASRYITDALTLMYEDGEDLTKTPNNTPKTIKWFYIVPVVTYLGFDNTVLDHAYNITYIIKEYSIPYVKSDFVSAVTKYYGAVKKYDYYYTGKNTEVIRYEQKFDNTYFVISTTTNNTYSTNKANTPKSTTRRNDQDSTTFGGIRGEAIASVKSALYDLSSSSEAQMQILGDPDLLIRTSAGALLPTALGNPNDSIPGINASNGQLFVEVLYKDATDYNSDGVMPPQTIEFPRQRIAERVKDTKPDSGIAYLLTSVKSTFSRGKFLMDLVLQGTDIDIESNQPASESKDQGPAGARAESEADIARKARSDFAKTDPRLIKQEISLWDKVTNKVTSVATNVKNSVVGNYQKLYGLSDDDQYNAAENKRLLAKNNEASFMKEDPREGLNKIDPVTLLPRRN